MKQFYTNPSRESDKWSLPDAVVYHLELLIEYENDDGEPNEAGWFYMFCLPGCLPDSGAFGPFKTEQEAIDDCRVQFGEE